MKANELRIGNLIFVDGKETTVKGWMIHLMQIGKNRDKVIEPIQLTEEWLIRFGFKFGINLQDFVKGKHQFVEFGTFNGYFFEKGILYFGINTKIRYVHQLQNLYFALTGEELTLKK